MHSHELTSHVKWRWFWQKQLARRSYLMIVPEINRGWILKMLSYSKSPFVVIPNHNYADITSTNISEYDFDILKFFRDLGGSDSCNRFIIYQGAIMENRSLLALINAFSLINSQDTGLIIMGEKNAFCAELESNCAKDNRIVFSPFIQPPNHLIITRSCCAGIVLYKPISLNSVYCAPNKIYEYASLGLPMLLPDYPGIQALNSVSNIGYLCDPLNVKSIHAALIKIIQNDQEELQKTIHQFIDTLPNIKDLYGNVHNILKARTIIANY